MKDDKRGQSEPSAGGGSLPNRILGTLREALAAASRDHTGEVTLGERTELLPRERDQQPPAGGQARAAAAPPRPASAAEAVREAKAPQRVHYEAEPTTRIVRGGAGAAAEGNRRPPLVDRAGDPPAGVVERPRAGHLGLGSHGRGPPSGEAAGGSAAFCLIGGPRRNSIDLAHWPIW